jgi:hypothetical protein
LLTFILTLSHLFVESTKIVPVGLGIDRIESLYQFLGLPRHIECERREFLGEFLPLRTILQTASFDAGVHQEGTAADEGLHNGVRALMDCRVVAALRDVFGFADNFADNDGDVIKVFFDGSSVVLRSYAANQGLDRL